MTNLDTCRTIPSESSAIVLVTIILSLKYDNSISLKTAITQNSLKRGACVERIKTQIP